MKNSRYLERSSGSWMAALAMILVAFATGCHCQSLYVVGVGENLQWTVPRTRDYYQGWADDRNFHVNDTLYFQYDSKLHNVLVVGTPEEVLHCNTTNPLASSTGGTAEITLTSNNANYYIMSLSGDGNDCIEGMSFAFSVGSTCNYTSSASSCSNGRQVVTDEIVSSLGVTTVPWMPADSNWRIPIYTHTAVSALVTFNYSKSDSYSVYRVAEDGYNQCNISNTTKMAFGASEHLFSGVYYFIDGNQSLCINSNMRLKVTISVSVAVLSVLAGIALAFAILCPIVYMCRKRRAHRRTKWRSVTDGGSYDAKDGKEKALQDKQLRDGMLRERNGIKTCKLFTLKELEVATSQFSKENELGSGAFGTVYKGLLKDGQSVAVKRAMFQRATDVEQFINEVSILSQVNHCNLVKLLGCCLELKVPLLVYEFIPNGTLQEHLSQSRLGHSTKLDWPRRFNIATNTAEALKYLHSQANPPIVHRDVKAANILLDDDFGAKVADFGLSKLVDIGATHVSTAIKGTPGYLDPEYYFNSQLTDRSDVYSYGMVLLELITSKKPVDLTLGPKEQNLAVRLVPVIMTKGARGIIDRHLVNGLSEEDFQIVEAVAEVAVACLVKERESRPCMTEVVEMLQRIRGSKLKAESFFRKDEIPIQNPRNSSSDWLFSAHDSNVESSDSEAGRLIMPYSVSSVEQSSSISHLPTFTSSSRS